MKQQIPLFAKKLLDWFHIPTDRQNLFLKHISIFIILMVLILSLDTDGFSDNLTEGKPAPDTIRAPRDISFVNEIKTKELKSAAMYRVEPVCVPLDPPPPESMSEQLEHRFKIITSFYNEYHDKEIETLTDSMVASYPEIDLILTDSELMQVKALRDSHFERMKTISEEILYLYFDRPIISSNIEKYRQEASDRVDSYTAPASLKNLIKSFISKSFIINSEEKIEQTKQKRLEAAMAVQPVKRTFQKGQKIVEEGAIVTSDDIYNVKKIAEQINKNRVFSIVGYFILSILVLFSSLLFLRLERRSLLGDIGQYKLIGVLFLVALAAIKIVIFISSASDRGFMALLFTPMPAVGILMSMLLDGLVAVFHVFLIGTVALVIAEANIKFIVISIFGALAGALIWRIINKSSDVRNMVGETGLKIGCVNAVGILCFICLDGDSVALMDLSQIAIYLGLGLVNGVLSGIAATGVLPYIERVFSLATTSRLYELSDLSHSLLKKLAEEAPGTYQHSIAVATLAEAGAAAIEADPLLTKISAYFHDIGKTIRPKYFAENLAKGEENPHNSITPFMSSLILTGHVRDGVDLGRDHKLPERVLNIMSQHHGTTLIRYFYAEARKKEGEDVSEERFRYPGPRPQSKEAAVLMLADSVEAAARTLPDHSYAKVEDLVNKIVDLKHNEEKQLEESNMTLTDIEKIKQVFIKTVVYMYHGRIDYPGKLSNAVKETNTDENSDQ